MIKPEDVPSLSDTELMKVLRQAGLNKGPITSTTRSLYEKKLMKFLEHSKLPENIAPVKTQSEKNFDKPKPHAVEPLKESNKNDVANTNSPKHVEKKPVKQSKPIKTLIQPDDEPVARVSVQKLSQNQLPNLAKRDDYAAKPVQTEKKMQPAQEKIMYPSASQNSQPIFTPPLSMQRNRNSSREMAESRSRSQTNSMLAKNEKKDPRSVSTKCVNSTLPLEFRLINNDETNTSVSDRCVKEERPFLGYIRADRQISHSDYLLNRRSFVKIDQSVPFRELNKSPEFNSKPLIDLSPQFSEKSKNASDQVSSSITITKLNQNQSDHSDWIRENFKYLLSVFVITIIVYYCLQATDEESIVL